MCVNSHDPMESLTARVIAIRFKGCKEFKRFKGATIHGCNWFDRCNWFNGCKRCNGFDEYEGRENVPHPLATF